MANVKLNSTQQLNKEGSLTACPVTYVMSKIGGRWKPIILYQLMSGPKRYSELKRGIPAITEKMLIQHLKQMQDDGLILRRSEPVVPPFVVYSLSAAGEDLRDAMRSLAQWGFKQQGRLELLDMAP